MSQFIGDARFGLEWLTEFNGVVQNSFTLSLFDGHYLIPASHSSRHFLFISFFLFFSVAGDENCELKNIIKNKINKMGVRT